MRTFSFLNTSRSASLILRSSTKIYNPQPQKPALDDPAPLLRISTPDKTLLPPFPVLDTVHLMLNINIVNDKFLHSLLLLHLHLRHIHAQLANLHPTTRRKRLPPRNP
jgi:hypothetical protein